MVTLTYAEEHPEEHLGRDLFLNRTGSLLVSSKDDLMQVRYYDNLKQAIINRLRTNFGELSLHPNYGSRLADLIGTSPDELTLSIVKMHIRESLLQEPRIDEIESITPVFRDNSSNTIIDVDLRVKPIKDLNTLNMIYSVFI